MAILKIEVNTVNAITVVTIPILSTKYVNISMGFKRIFIFNKNSDMLANIF